MLNNFLLNTIILTHDLCLASVELGYKTNKQTNI